jgi:thymidylate synthase
MYSDVRRDLHEMGTLVHPQTMQDRNVADDPQYRTLELSPYCFTILDGSDRLAWLIGMKKSWEWVDAELKERVKCHEHHSQVYSGINPGTAWRLRSDVWAPFLHDGKVFAYTYSERFSLGAYALGKEYSALRRVIAELQAHPDTRQAVLPIFNADLDLPNMGGIARIPCSMHYQFLRRDDKLHMIYTMRSSDFLTHFPYDIALALELQAYIARILEIPVGPMTFFTGSLHLYAKDADPGVF